MSPPGSFGALTARAPAKINLGLFVGPRRADGRHEIASVMQSISLCDELTLAPASGGQDELLCPGVDGPAAENLALRALAAFRAATGWEGSPARVSVVKRVPVAAGLGGGSADAAAVLRLAAAASGLGEAAPLAAIAAELGADVPAQVRPGRWFAEGVGERLRALPEAAQFGVLVLPSRAALSTAAVYAELDRRDCGRSASELERNGAALLDALPGSAGLPAAEHLANDLQDVAIGLQPSIERALAEARDAGADVALLSGSGPTVLGLFEGAHGPERARRAAAQLRRSPAAIAAVPVDASFAAVASAGAR